jgi:hypothetical protein
MAHPNAFIGKTAHPTTAELTATLGKTNELWDELVDWLAQEHGVTDREWTCSGAKYGWALRLKLKKRAIWHPTLSAGKPRKGWGTEDYSKSENALEHFRKICRPKVHWHPTHSAGKRGMDGARRSIANPKML